ncbi:MAG TPA: Ppx/GppA phosphatase family protein [Vicinamibacteria bacterium]|nr:Ppx/GppA phosphatase family protein [Vicinamibacteria bacterium]
MKIAAIDIGSNSIHMVVVEVQGSGGFQVIEREKEMVRLGAGTLARGNLSAGAMKRGLAVLTKYKQLARNHRVDKVVAVATSAVREARNGEDFLERVGRETGIWPRVASGEGEARLIYLAALHSIHLEGKRALVVDIGGGSLELCLGAGRRLDWAVSEKLGVLRMTERFVRSDPLSAKDEARLREAITGAIAPHAAAVREAGFECAVGTSGTILALGAMARHAEDGRLPETLHHVTVSARAIHDLRERLVASTERERLRLPGMDERRADLVVAGAVLLDTVLESFGVHELTLCEWALREGILLDYIDRHPRTLARAEAIPDPRRRSVVSLAERCLFDEAHARHVASLSLSLFDQTREKHGLEDEERALLEYAALLHDIGHHISYPGHHKHTYYLIKNGGLRGFDPVEIELVANVARYHRRGHPRKAHAEFEALPKPARQVVRVLAGILRVADALDRSHRQAIRTLTVAERGGALRIRGEATGDCELELWGVLRRTPLLEEALGLPVRVEVARAAKAGPTRIQAARA